MNENVKRLIDEAFENMFSLEAKRNENLDLVYTIKNQYLNRQCGALYTKANWKMSYNHFKGTYIYYCYLVMLNYDATEQQWAEIEELTRNGEFEVGEADKFGRYIHGHVKYKTLKDFQSENSRWVRNGDRSTKIVFDSVNFSDVVRDDEDVDMNRFLDDNRDIFRCDEGDYYKSDFAIWFEARKDEILRKSQLDFLERYEKAHYLMGERHSNEEIEAITETSTKNIDKKIRAIQNRILKAYNKEFGTNLELHEIMTAKIKHYKIEKNAKIVKISNMQNNPTTVESY